MNAAYNDSLRPRCVTVLFVAVAGCICAQNVTEVRITSGAQVSTLTIGHQAPPSAADSDNNGLPDAWELQHFQQTGNDPGADADSDGLSNSQEQQLGSNPGNANTDGDDLSDGQEPLLGNDPTVPDPVLVPTVTWLSRVTADTYQEGEVLPAPGLAGFLPGTTQNYRKLVILQTVTEELPAGYESGVTDLGQRTFTAEYNPTDPNNWDISGERIRKDRYPDPEVFSIYPMKIIWHNSAVGYPGATEDNHVHYSEQLYYHPPYLESVFIYYTVTFDMTLSDPGEPVVIAPHWVQSTESWTAQMPSVSRSDTASSSADYRLAIPPGSTGTLRWFEVFTPADGGDRQYTLMEWPIEGAISPVYTLNAPAAGTATVELFAELAVDANRDGVIKLASEDASDATTATQPYRFWVNDDDDLGDDKRTRADDIPLPEGDNNRDSANSLVDGIRDLEDFFPIYLNLKLLLSELPPGTNGVSYFLKQEEEAVGVVFTSYTRTQAFDYLRGTPANLNTGFGPALTQKGGEATVTKITAAGVDLFAASPAFQTQIQNNDSGVLLVEACKATTKPLVLEVRKGSGVIATVKLELKIDPVETMFHYHNLRSYAHGTAIATNNQGPNYGFSTPGDAPCDPFQSATSRKNIIFVHGYNVNAEAARGSAGTAFKRFYWSGSKAKFYAVLWRGDDGQGEGIVPAGATPDYHRNVGHAWQQGPYLRDFLLGLEGDTAIMAHSLGNMVTQVALTYERDPYNAARLRPASRPPAVKNYFAIDAALPLEATAVGDITNTSKTRMRHSWWAEYDTLERLWPTHWHELFAGTGDGRVGLTWRAVFAGLDVGTNFYSSGEEVLANPEDDSMPFWEPLFFGGLHAWVAQEKLKGGNGAAAPFFRSWTAGWVENKAWYVPIVPTPPIGSPQTRRRFASEAQDVTAPNGVPASALASEPFFQRFQASEDGVYYPGYQGLRLHAAVGDANADDEARKLVTVAKCLGEAIPVLSYAQGRNSATKFDDLSGNFDLNKPYDSNSGLGFRNGWPTSRSSQSWLHSDCLDVAYIFHFMFYDRMKTDGGLQ